LKKRLPFRVRRLPDFLLDKQLRPGMRRVRERKLRPENALRGSANL
jgi:hypothetical protein